MRTLYTFICEWCGKKFESDRRQRKCCSRECTEKNRIKEPFKFICKECGKEFTDKKHPDRQFCSMQCSGTHSFVTLGNHGSGPPLIAPKDLFCEICGKKFQNKKHPKAKTCSSRCKGLATRTLPRYEFICIICGKEIIDIRDRKYCSIECSGKAKINPSIRNRDCLNCQAIFRPKKWNCTCCSIKCRDEYRHKNRLVKICQYCGVIFYPHNILRVHCSLECFHKLIASSIPSYRKGLNFTIPVKRLIKERDKSCVECWSTENLEYDHIIAICNAEGLTADFISSVENGQLLCVKCHARKSNNDRKIWRELCKRRIALDFYVLD